MRQTHISLLVLSTLLMTPPLYAAQWVDSLLEDLGSSETVDESKPIDWGVLPGPFYNPEMGVGIGAAAIGLYRVDKQDRDTQYSTLSFTGFASSTGAFGVGFENNTFLQQDTWRLFLKGAVKNVPTSFWGIGYAAGSQDSNKREYTAKALEFTPELAYRVAPDLYAALGGSLVRLSTESDEPLFTALPGGERNQSIGVSARLSYDSRDFLPNPYRGQVASVKYTRYLPALGSDADFSTVEARYSYYWQLSVRTILASEVYGYFTHGDVPWNQLAQLGSDKRMRGYYEGQYTDRNLLTTQLELRQQLSGRHGVALWAGAGTVTAHARELLDAEAHWLPNAGVGYRFAFKPRVNIRLDWGVGRNTSGFYFQVNEAF